MVEFCGLRSKMYSFRTEKGFEKKVGKGVKKNILKTNLKFKHYKNVMDKHSKVYVKQTTIQSRKHSVSTHHQRKLGLSCFDDKRYWLDDVASFAHGHHKIRGHQRKNNLLDEDYYGL